MVENSDRREGGKTQKKRKSSKWKITATISYKTQVTVGDTSQVVKVDMRAAVGLNT